MFGGSNREFLLTFHELLLKVLNDLKVLAVSPSSTLKENITCR